MAKKKLDSYLYSATYLVPHDSGKKKSTKGVISKLNDDEDKVTEGVALLERCSEYWSSLQEFRERRERSRKYERGDQWFEKIQNDAGEWVSEESLILSENRLALKQNVIRKLMKNLVGQYRTNPAKSVVNTRNREDASLSEMMTNALQAAKDLNATVELDAQQFHEHALSGMICGKVGFKPWKELDRNEATIDNINVNRIFYNTDVMDIRMKDLDMIGEIIDTTLDNIISLFARSEGDAEWIREEYRQHRGANSVNQSAGTSEIVDSLDFYNCQETKVRLYEVWYVRSEWRIWVHDFADGTYKFYPEEDEEALNQMMASRMIQAAENGVEPIPMEVEKKYEQFWYVKYLTPTGRILFEGETPYLHQSHPYVLNLYPLLDGEVWGIVEDVIDQQRYINRLISLLDYIMGTQAKGLLMIPEGAIPEDSSPEEFADQHTKIGGVIVYNPTRSGEIPKIISSNSSNIGASEILGVQMQLINELTGINQAIQGQPGSSDTPASKYAMETQNSSMNNRDLVDNFFSWIQRRDDKILQTIMQFYDEKIYLGVSGKSYSDEAKYFDPEAIKDVKFKTNVTQSQDTPVYRQMIDDTLMKLAEMGIIDGKIFLENSSLPGADKILDALGKRQEEVQERGGEEGMDQGTQLPQGIIEGLKQPGKVDIPNN